VMVCATDNGCRIAQPDPYRTVAKSTRDGTLFGGDLVLAKSSGYWTAWSQGSTVRISRFTTGKAKKTIKPKVSSQHPHLVKLGSKRMLLAWGSGAKTKLRILNRSTGATVKTLSVSVRDHDYLAWKEYKDGSAAYAGKGKNSTSVRIARVLPTTI